MLGYLIYFWLANIDAMGLLKDFALKFAFSAPRKNVS